MRIWSWSQWSLTFEVRKRRPLSFHLRAVFASQWSLTFEVRKRRTWLAMVAPEPSSQWSLTFEVRKRLHVICDVQDRQDGRNGA